MSADRMGGGIGDPQSRNLYAYALNNPTNNVDPYGFDSCSASGSVINCTLSYYGGGSGSGGISWSGGPFGSSGGGYGGGSIWGWTGGFVGPPLYVGSFSISPSFN